MFEAGLGGPADPDRARDLFRLAGRTGGDAAVAAAAAETVSDVRAAAAAAAESGRAAVAAAVESAARFLHSLFG
jgi:hypothetical protein